MKEAELQHQSFRLPRALLDRLRGRAASWQASQASLVARYIDEGIKLDTYPLIVFRDSPVGRRAMLEGSRLDVAQVVQTLRNEGGSVEAAAAHLSLTPAQIRACVRYYADNEDEVRAYSERMDAENERLRASCEREQAVLT
jgi:uncharacterized protein (DUF433 family)